MSFVLELRFATQSEVFIHSLMQQLEDLGLPSNLLEKTVSPHLTLVAAKTMPESVLSHLDDALADFGSFPITLVSLSTFLNQEVVLFLGAIVSQPLLALHETVYGCYGLNQENLNPYYLPRRWVPHITLVTNYTREKLAQAVKGLELTLPYELQVSSLAFVEYPTLNLLKRWDFS